MTGVELLVRGGRGVSPTAAGEALLHHARQVLTGIDRMRSELSEYAEGVRGHLRVFANVSSIAEFLPGDLSTFLARHPNVRLDLHERVSPAVVLGVRERAVDLGICWGVVDMASLQVMPYDNDELMVVVHPDHPLGRKASVRFDETLAYEFVGLQPGSLVNAVLSGVAARTGKSVDYRIHVTTFEAATAIVAANLAICVIPSEATRAYESSRGLRVVPLAEDWARREIVLCMRDYDALPVHGRAFVDHLRECGAARRSLRT